MEEYTSSLSDLVLRVPQGFFRAGIGLTGELSGIIASVSERCDAHTRWVELRNKIRAYQLFEGRDLLGREADLNMVRGLDDFSRMWAAEGYAHRQIRTRGALTALGEVPRDRRNLVSWHAGVGLRLAENLLDEVRPPTLERTLDRFLEDNRAFGIPGFSGILDESLGLVARNLFPGLVEQIDFCLRYIDPIATARFWHGVGRGIYFNPGNALPFCTVPWRGLQMCKLEPPHDLGKRNSVSGFCFALTLVNLLNPEVLEAFLQHHPDEATSCEASEGVSSAFCVWTLASDDVRVLERIRDHQPVFSQSQILWEIFRSAASSAIKAVPSKPEALFSVG